MPGPPSKKRSRHIRKRHAASPLLRFSAAPLLKRIGRISRVSCISVSAHRRISRLFRVKRSRRLFAAFARGKGEEKSRQFGGRAYPCVKPDARLSQQTPWRTLPLLPRRSKNFCLLCKTLWFVLFLKNPIAIFERLHYTRGNCRNAAERPEKKGWIRL